MQQRRYRPGDVLDDYCPRERRITDHAIVAMIDEHIKQTRCVVCDAEHEYKDGKVPSQRRKRPPAALFNQVLDGLQGPQPPARLAAAPPEADDPFDDDAPALPPPVVIAAAEQAPSPRLASVPEPASMAPAPAPPPRPAATRHDEGPVRRQLIRAALPRPEGQPPPQQTRAMPEFTIHQPKPRGGRGGRRRGGHGGGHGQPGQGGQGGQGFGGGSRFGRSGNEAQSRRRGRGKK